MKILPNWYFRWGYVVDLIIIIGIFIYFNK